jgi:Asp-tRNA(Asn)/Glu-tRNA(Gln) amidotransferase A subunit family amidase
LPAGFSPDNMPIGMQLIARNLEEARLLRAGMALQAATGWHRRHPLP